MFVGKIFPGFFRIPAKQLLNICLTFAKHELRMVTIAKHLLNIMKQYSLRSLYANLGKAITELPFEITNHNRVVAVVMAPDETAAIFHAIENGPKGVGDKPTGPMLVTKKGKFVKPTLDSKILDGISTNSLKEIKEKVQQANAEAPKSKLCPDCGSLLDIYGQCQNRFRHKKKK